MISDQPAKFGRMRRYNVLVVKKQHFTCSRLNPLLLFISKGHGLKTRHFILESPILVTGACRRNISKIYKQFLPVHPETRLGRRKRKQEMTIVKFFVLNANTIQLGKTLILSRNKNF